MKLHHRIAAITGAGQGIGQAGAVLFAKEGAHVVLLEINENNGLETKKIIDCNGGKATFIKTDISDSKSVAHAFKTIDQTFGRLDVLYNNASVFLGNEDNMVSLLSDDTWDKILKINLYGMFYCCKYGIPIMTKSGGGSIIHTSSSAGVIGIPKCDAYTASKGATISLTRSMAVEYGPQNIRINCIAPAAIDTPMVIESNRKDPTFDEEAFLNKGTPLRRWGKPEEIAQIAAFLASDESSYLNGAVLVADGGITIS